MITNQNINLSLNCEFKYVMWKYLPSEVWNHPYQNSKIQQDV